MNLYVERTRVLFNFYRKNMPSLLCFMAKNDVKDFDWSKHLTSFSAMKHNKDGIFFDKSSLALEFFQHVVSKLKIINLERNY